MQLTALAKVATFWQGNRYILGTLLSTMNAIEKGTINWVEQFKVRLHKEMITIQRKAKKVGNCLIEPTLTLVTKYYVVLEYAKEDEKEPIVFFNAQRR